MSDDGIGAMARKTVLVTGGTSGIGKATAAGVARLGARVGIVGRDRRRAEESAASTFVARQTYHAIRADLATTALDDP
jgi:NAD(P)-dependent dehydrogenase (short-subunit alcohol dehydrogenase family)